MRASFVVATLGLFLLFSALLTGCNVQAPVPIATNTPVVIIVVATPTQELAKTLEPTAVVANATPTTLPISNNTSTPTPTTEPQTAVPTNTSTATETQAPTDTPTATFTMTPTETSAPTSTSTSTPTATPEAHTRNLYSTYLVKHGPTLLGDKGDDYINTAEMLSAGCEIVNLFGVEYDARGQVSAPMKSTSDIGHGWSVSKQTNDVRDLGGKVHWWYNPAKEVKMRLYYVVREPWNVDCNVRGKTQEKP